MTSIAILGAAAVQADAVSHAQAMGLTVHVLAASEDGPAVREADVFVALDFSNIPAVVEYARAEGLAAVYSVGSDIAMPVSAAVSQELGLPKFVSVETAKTCNSKPDMRHALNGNRGNVPSASVRTARNAKWDGRWPVIVKPADAQGQRGVSRVDEHKDLQRAIDAAMPHSRTGSAIIEEFIEGPEISVNGYMVAGDLAFMAISDRVTWSKFTGLVAAHVMPSAHETPRIRRDVEFVLTSAAAQLGIENGPIYAQMMLRQDEPFIIEVTPRLDGCHMWKVIRASTGIDLLAATLENLLVGKKPEFPGREAVRFSPVRLDFHCQTPGTSYSSADFPPPNDVIDRYSYYTEGATVREVNGRFDKVGYDLRAELPVWPA